MCVQDPPVEIDSDDTTGQRFNAAKYKAYTRTGLTVEYTVWPALYLHKDGALLCKGVAQGNGRQ